MSMILHICIVYSSNLFSVCVCVIPLYECTITYLSVLWLVDIWVFPSVLPIMNKGALLILGRSFFLGVYLRVELWVIKQVYV